MPFRKLCVPALTLVCLQLLCAGARAQTNDRAQAAAEIESLREQIKAREAVLLAPAPEDYEAHAAFLSQPETGLLRLLPREKWNSKLSTRGDGAFYSFARKTHEYGYGTDIGLEGDKLQVGFAGANFGFVANLGDIPLASVTTESEGVKYLAAFDTPAGEPEAREQQRRTRAGFEVDGHRYTNRLPAAANNTYIMRSVDYQNSDTLVAFRVLRKDADGSVVLLWKVLKKFPKPKLEMHAAAAAGQ
ncbi:MAG TPA: hypothetical protein VGX48_00655 [Pyrinomonadaceae bacterium]|jgi:hypothetical protein|nr:hypothetical protein [Pyrinomonadaceae bacterium]